MKTHLEEGEGDAHTVVFVAGGNDLQYKHMSLSALNRVADHLIKGGLACVNEYGVSRVLISSVLPRKNSDFQCNRHQLNNILKARCEEHGFQFVANSDIILRPHICWDGVHLNAEGSDLLRINLLDALHKK
jgi:lysophospholipase L1-like esterase